uniref:Carboxylesterase type B domain-containing protein n=1 Tax=Arion vulgaris TaxID=1028688 RepID=A0A0B7AVP9_9EUPU
MSNFGYDQLQDDSDSPRASADCSHIPKTSLSTASTSKTLFGSLQLNDDTDHERKSQLEPDHDNRLNSENVRYTALQPTFVRELTDTDLERESVSIEGTDSSILVAITSDRKKKSISKIYVIICGLLITCVILVSFSLIYVFIILPIYRGKDAHPDPRVQPSDQVTNFGENVVKTSCGFVRGKKTEDAYVFLGIPYAVPPIRDQRWKPPVSKDVGDATMSWNGIYNATVYGSKCIQPNFWDTSKVEGSEDCLYLNIWTPTLDPKKLLPVVVWFHSGDFVYGSGHMLGMTPTPGTTVATNFVYVSFNYRLGVFGFLALDELRQEPGEAAGNYGFMDQQLVLKWVKANIRQFGGNENMVTIFGHGSGATSVHAMLLSPASRGLFHKAWLISPAAVVNKTVDDACRDNKSFMKTSGCRTLHCLLQLSAVEISRSSPWSLQPHWTLEQLFDIPRTSQLRNDLPIFDGQVIPLPSQESRSAGPIVPVVFGSTYFDLSSLDTEQTVVNITWDEYNQLMTQHVGGLGSDAITQAISLYSNKRHFENTGPHNFLSPASLQFLHLVGDIKNTCRVKMLANSFVTLFSNKSSVYMYLADIYPSDNIKLSSNEDNTFVGWDIVALFNTFQDLDFVVGQEELNFQNILREEFMRFVVSGQPDVSRWKTADVNVGVIGRDVTVNPVTSEYFAQCDFWKKYDFLKYTWNKGR